MGMKPPSLTAEHLRKLDIFAGHDRELVPTASHQEKTVTGW